MHETTAERSNNPHHHHHHHTRSQTTRHQSNGTQTNGHHHHHQGCSNGWKSPSRMACEKASRKLRATLVKAARWGVSNGELARLPAAKKIASQRDRDWKLAVLLLLMFGGGVIVALVCTTSRGCSKIEDIVSTFISMYFNRYKNHSK